jgi:hypothetical protein
MTSLATIVFKSGAAIEMPFAPAQATRLLEYFEENWDETGPELYVPATEKSSGCRLVPSEIVGIFIAQADDADSEEEEEGDDEADEDDDEIEDEDDEEDQEAAKAA